MRMDSLGSMLKKYNVDQPEEITAIKRYIFENHGQESSVSLRGKSLVITVGSAPLANTLRLQITQLKKLVPKGTSISFRIG